MSFFYILAYITVINFVLSDVATMVTMNFSSTLFTRSYPAEISSNFNIPYFPPYINICGDLILLAGCLSTARNKEVWNTFRKKNCFNYMLAIVSVFYTCLYTHKVNLSTEYFG